MPQYEVVRIGGALPVMAPEFGVLSAAVLPDGLCPKEFAVRPKGDPEWRRREALRFEDGTYRKVPWPSDILWRLEEQYPDHFLHLSLKDPGKVSFTESADKGAIDRQSAPMAPGRYLERYARSYRWDDSDRSKPPEGPAWFDGEEIRRLSALLVEPDAMKFATTADEIERVYVKGPNSCMSGTPDEYRSSVHPVRVYAAGDLAVAYLMSGTAITARALCWPDKKVFGRPYGDEHRLIVALEAQGYSKGELVGAKLLRIEDENGKVICPYIDRHNYVEDDGKHLRISNHGRNACGTNGYLSGFECCSCGADVDEDDTHEWHGDILCESCYCDRTFYCEGYDETCDRDEYFGHVEGVGNVSQAYYDNHCYTCERLERAYNTEDHPPVTMANGETWGPDAFERYGGTCEMTDEAYPFDDLVLLQDTQQYVCLDWANEHAHEKDGEFYKRDPDQSELDLEAA